MKLFVPAMSTLLFAANLFASDFPTGVFTCRTVEKYCSEFESTGFPQECREGSQISVEILSLQMGGRNLPYILYKTSFYNQGEGYNPYFTDSREGVGTIARSSSAADPVLAITLPSVIAIEFFSEGNETSPYVSDLNGNEMYECKKGESI